ncbi:MAG: hypothetical protein GXN93_00700 [Candidatus Diapherotrites archaeon]|nr:hypothetical protein [Candidatus Diapherotrites archaeon]
MLSIRTLISPYKLVLHESGRVTLEVTVTNKSSEPRLVSVTVETPHELALNTGGFVHRDERRIGTLKPGESKTIVFTIFARPTTTPGRYELRVVGMEHEENYDYVIQESEKTVPLTVIQ